MKRLSLLASLCLPAVSLSLSAQEKSPPDAAPRPTLTPEQMKNVLKQLDDLEKSIMQQRGTDLGGIIQRIRSAASSDAAAVNFVAECDKLVNVERKDGDRKDAQRIEKRKEEEKRGESKKVEDKDGDHAVGLRMCLDYLALTLEAHEAKELSSMIPKVQAFHQSLLGQAKKLKGATGDMVMRGLGGGRGNGGGRRGGGGGEIGAVIQAYQLDAFLEREGWPLEPGDIIKMYDKVILESVREKKKDEIGSTWDTAINLEASFQKERLPEGEFAVWQKQDYPSHRWHKAQDMTSHGTNPIAGMAEMLKVIKEFPSHPASPKWVSELRLLVTPPGAEAPEPTKP